MFALEVHSLFKNRKEAGRLLAQKFEEMSVIGEKVVLAIPRGGVIVAAQVAQALQAPLDIIVPRKIGAPSSPELAVGAVAPDGKAVFNHELLSKLNLQVEDLRDVLQKEIKEIARRLEEYRRDREILSLENKAVILVDDGIATGYTVKAALDYIRRHKPSRTILAIPVAPPEIMEKFQEDAGEVICLHTPTPFYAVGQFYEHFPQETDRGIIKILKENRRQPL